MSAILVYDPAMADYRFGGDHPMRPERFSLAVALMRKWGILAEPGDPPSDTRAGVVRPEPATDDDILLFHTPELLAAVKAASADPSRFDMRFGIGPGDTPAFAGMHEAAASAVGGTITAMEAVLGGDVLRAFVPAGGLHHAHRDRAAGFCVYNDCAIAIERATRERPGLQVAYVDIDAHHGDGVQEAFYDRADVLTVSMHESGRFLYPGTGMASETGVGEGRGFAVNVPMPPDAGDAEYAAAFEAAVAPAVADFGPDIVVAQLGGDGHRGDPLTHLELSVAGHRALVHRIVELADEHCDGRIVATGGGGYQPFDVVPTMWALAMAELLGVDVPTPDEPIEPISAE
ncbi:MAG: acetoin utilization protein AcuC [Coriobacteriales bacterium]|nr:acetoin utilization protein AcuC [Coriobacteriales bacterium]